MEFAVPDPLDCPPRSAPGEVIDGGLGETNPVCADGTTSPRLLL